MDKPLLEKTEPKFDAAALPRHIAIIMDGNGRWAKKRLLPRTAGHQAGVSAVRKTVEYCVEIGIEALTLFAFSSENWRRPQKEVSTLMGLLFSTLDKESEELGQNGVRLRVIGDRSVFEDRLQKKIKECENATATNRGLNLVIALNYGGRWDILQAVQKIAQKVADGSVLPTAITSEIVESNLSFSGLPEPDLFIRTGGDRRISNFVLWQLAYTELYFTPILWPDFDRLSLGGAIQDYASRQRRFGYTGDQVESRNGISQCAR